MTPRAMPVRLAALAGAVLLPLACQPPAQPGLAGNPATASSPGTLPAKATLPLARLSPAASRPADDPDADQLPERARDAVAEAEAELAKENFFRARELFERARGFAPNVPRIERGLGLAFVGLGDRARAEPHLRESIRKAPDHVRVQFLLGQYAAMQGDFQEATLRFRTALLCRDAVPDNPDTAEVVLLLGAALESEGYWTASLECFRTLAELIAAHGAAYANRPVLRELVTQPERCLVRQGRALLALGRNDEAAVVLDRAYRRDKSHPEAGVLAVKALLAQRQFDRAEGIVVEMLTEPVHRERAVALAAELCRARNDPDMPARLLDSYLGRGGRDLGFVIGMAEVAADMGQMDKAREMLSRHVSGTPEDPRMLLRLARLSVHTGDLAGAARQLAALLAMDVPASHQVAMELGALRRKGAGKDLSAGLAASAEKAEGSLKPALLTVAGMLVEGDDDPQRAVGLFRAAVKADDRFWPAYEALAGLYVRQGDHQALQQLLREVTELAGDGYFGLYLAGKTNLQRGQLADAVSNLEQALAKKTDHLPSLLLLGRAYNLQGLLRDAEQRFGGARKIAPDDVEVVRELSEFYLVRGHPANALRLLNDFLRDNPKSVPARAMLGHCYFVGNQIDQARKELEALQAQAPDDPEVVLLSLRFELPQSLEGSPIAADKAKAALDKLQRVGRLDPGNLAAGRLMSALLVNQKEYLQAAKVLESLRRRAPHDVRLASEYLDALVRGKAEAQAVSAVEQIAGTPPLGSGMRLMLLEKLIALKRFDLACQYAEKWLAEPADEGDLRQLRLRAMQAYEEARQFDKAHRLVDDWIASGAEEPVLSLLRRQKLHLYGLEKRYDDAVAYVRKWMRNEPGKDLPRNLLLAALMEAKAYDKAHAAVDEWLGEADADTARRLKAAKVMIFAQEGEFDRLIEFGKKWIAEDPDSLASEIVVAALAGEKKYDQALKIAEGWLASQEKLAASDPKKAKTLYEARRAVIQVLWEAKRNREALARARRFAQAAPEDVRVLHLLYGALSGAERPDEAASLLEKMFALDADDPGVNNDLGYSWADRGIKLDRAEYMIRKALAARPNEVAFQDSLAWVLYKQGRFSEAKTVFDQALRAEESRLHSVILDHAGDTCWRLGLKQEAIRLWRRALEMAEKSEDKGHDTKKVLGETPQKISTAQRGAEPRVAPLGEGAR